MEYQFEWTIESEDASEKEASHCNPPKTDLTNNQCLEAISMLLLMATEAHLKRGSIIAIAKRFNMDTYTMEACGAHVHYGHN